MIDQLKELYRTNKVFAAFVIGLAVSSVMLAVFLLAVSAHQVRTFFNGNNYQYSTSITVEGVGTEEFVPDVAEFTFGVNEEAPTFAASQKLASDKVTKAVDFLKSKGVEEKDIDTDSINTNEVFNYPPCNTYECPQPISRGFATNQNVTVKVRNIDSVGELVGGMGEFKLSYVGAVTKTVDDVEAVKDRARAKAIEDAREKAEVLADSLDVRLVRLAGFYENAPYPMPYYDGYGYGGDMMRAEAQSANVAIPIGEGEYESRVSLTYEIR
jgi:uncharacterized protein YggE